MSSNSSNSSDELYVNFSSVPLTIETVELSISSIKELSEVALEAVSEESDIIKKITIAHNFFSDITGISLYNHETLHKLLDEAGVFNNDLS